jgi:hypothetical protein
MGFQAIYIRDIGTVDEPVAYAGVDDSGNLVMEEGDGKFDTFMVENIELCSKAPKETVCKFEELDACLYVTDSRVVLRCDRYDKGGGWMGLGGSGLIVAGIANAVSKSRAKQRSAGTVLLGQIRYEWLQNILAFSKKGILGFEALTLQYKDVEGMEWSVDLMLPKKSSDAKAIAREIVRRAIMYKLSMPDIKSQGARDYYNELQIKGLSPAGDSSEHVIFPTFCLAPTIENERDIVDTKPKTTEGETVSQPIPEHRPVTEQFRNDDKAEAPITPPSETLREQPPAPKFAVEEKQSIVPASETPPKQPAFCRKCGSSLQGLSENARFCPKCGAGIYPTV